MLVLVFLFMFVFVFVCCVLRGCVYVSVCVGFVLVFV